MEPHLASAAILQGMNRFPSAPRPGGRGFVQPLLVFVAGALLIALEFSSNWFNFSLGVLQLSTFVGGLLLAVLGLLQAIDRLRHRAYWRTGAIQPAIVITKARLPAPPNWLAALGMVAVAITYAITVGFDLLGIAGFAIGSAVFGRLGSKLTRAQVFFCYRGEELVAPVPTGKLWRELTPGSYVYVLIRNNRVCSMHVAAPLPYSQMRPSDRESEAMDIELAAFIKEHDESA